MLGLCLLAQCGKENQTKAPHSHCLLSPSIVFCGGVALLQKQWLVLCHSFWNLHELLSSASLCQLRPTLVSKGNSTQFQDLIQQKNKLKVCLYLGLSDIFSCLFVFCVLLK